jgi:curved DNA-binding protein CbpA
MNDPYVTLGVPREATQDDVKQAYRRRAMETHPDRPEVTDNGEEFKLVQAAYECLGDPQRRLHYDQTGEDVRSNEADERKNAAYQAIAATIEAITMSENIATTDLIAATKMNVDAYIRGLKDLKTKCEKLIDIKQRVLMRLRSTGSTMVHDILTEGINREIEQIKRHDKELAQSAVILETLKEFTYQVDKAEPPPLSVLQLPYRRTIDPFGPRH